MSGYFEALMHASGVLAPQPTQRHTGTGLDAAPPGFVVEDCEAADQPRAGAPGLPPAAPRPPAPPAQSANGANVPEAPPRRPLPQPEVAVEPAPAKPASAPQPQAASRQHAAAPPPAQPAALLHPLARVAMDWVARDNPAPGRKETDAARPAAPVPVSHQDDAEPVRTAPHATPIREPRHDSEPWPGTTSGVAAQAPDERVEVTIGAIHLRVEAPAAPTATTAAPPAPPAGAVEPLSSARSSLARRSLRRI